VNYDTVAAPPRACRPAATGSRSKARLYMVDGRQRSRMAYNT